MAFSRRWFLGGTAAAGAAAAVSKIENALAQPADTPEASEFPKKMIDSKDWSHVADLSPEQARSQVLETLASLGAAHESKDYSVAIDYEPGDGLTYVIVQRVIEPDFLLAGTATVKGKFTSIAEVRKAHLNSASAVLRRLKNPEEIRRIFSRPTGRRSLVSDRAVINGYFSMQFDPNVGKVGGGWISRPFVEGGSTLGIPDTDDKDTVRLDTSNEDQIRTWTRLFHGTFERFRPQM